MAQISATFFRATATAPLFFYFSAIASCATFFSLRQWCSGAKSGVSAQHCHFKFENLIPWGD